MYLRERADKVKREEERLLWKVLRNERSACNANNTNQLLTEGWSEDKHAYRLSSKITPGAEKRVKAVIN